MPRSTGRSSAAGRATTTPVDRTAERPRGAPRPARPGSRRSRRQHDPVDGRRPWRGLRERARGAASDLAVGPEQPRPADPDHVRPPAARPQRRATTARHRRLALGPRRRSRAGGPSRRALAQPDARAGRIGRRPGQHELDGQPGSRAGRGRQAAWFDQRRPLVTSVSAPSASAAPMRNSRLRSLLPPNASGSRSSRLIQISPGRPAPPRTAAGRWSGDGARTAGSGAVGGQRGIGPMVAAVSSARWPPGSPPADRRTSVGQHAGMERSIAISRPTVGSERLYSVDRLDRARRQDPRSTITATARRRSTSCRARPATRGARPGWSTR